MMLLKVLFVVFLVQLTYCKDYSRGLGESYAWKSSLRDAVSLARRLDRPVMVIIHKPSDARSTSLKEVFKNSRNLKDKSEKFVMLNLTEDDKSDAFDLSPDGNYFPRIIFIRGSREIFEVNNNGSSDFRFFYNSEHSILDAMDRALKVREEDEPEEP